MHPQNAKESFNDDSTVILSGPGNVKHRKEKHLTAIQWQVKLSSQNSLLRFFRIFCIFTFKLLCNFSPKKKKEFSDIFKREIKETKD